MLVVFYLSMSWCCLNPGFSGCCLQLQGSKGSAKERQLCPTAKGSRGGQRVIVLIVMIRYEKDIMWHKAVEDAGLVDAELDKTTDQAQFDSRFLTL